MDIVHDPITAGLVRAIPAGKAMVENRQLFTSSGTWTRPAAMVGNPIITMIAGGASGSKGSPYLGGDGGQYVIDLLVNIGSNTSVPITIGIGGVSSATTSKNAGSTSSFGTYVSVAGGVGGSIYSGGAADGAAGGAGSSPQGQSTPLGPGGIGVSFGAGGGGLVMDSSGVKGGAPEGAAAKGYGAGGGSSYTSNGGAGAPGACLVKWMETV